MTASLSTRIFALTLTRFKVISRLANYGCSITEPKSLSIVSYSTYMYSAMMLCLSWVLDGTHYQHDVWIHCNRYLHQARVILHRSIQMNITKGQMLRREHETTKRNKHFRENRYLVHLSFMHPLCIDYFACTSHNNTSLNHLALNTTSLLCVW